MAAAAAPDAAAAAPDAESPPRAFGHIATP